MSAVLLILYNAKENISYFYTPSELNSSNIKLNKQIRIGGFVEKNRDMFNAITVFAKHDENYMPSSIKSDLENSGYWNKKY